MNVTQTYAHASRAAVDERGLSLSVAAETSRPPVRLDAQIHDSLGYARVMLALYAVVSSDLRSRQVDHSAYQKWVQDRYLEELTAAQGAALARIPELRARLDRLRADQSALLEQIHPLEQTVHSAEFYQQRQKYFTWLYTHDRDAWYVLDPVISVHPDAVIFEVFSQDESSYGRVTVPTEKLTRYGETVYGTTNVDYSRALADEMRRVRSYRPAFLKVEGGGVALATGAGGRVEKKIDLPPSWVRGFLQVQSAATLSATALTLSPETLADIFAALQSRREAEGPRSLRFILTPGERPSVVIEPWGTVVTERVHAFAGDTAQEIRLWGRRRLLTLAELMPHAERVEVRLLGTGMPSYWSVVLDGHRFDLGVSGWTKNDWSSAARFDQLAANAPVSDGDRAVAAQRLESRLALTPRALSESTDLPEETAAAALQGLCREGLALFDVANGAYRWRQLLPFPAPADEADARSRLAARLAQTGCVAFYTPGDDAGDGFGAPPGTGETFRFHARVRGGEGKRDRRYTVTLDLDTDGRVRFAQCDCSWHRREKLRKGPCAHILATAGMASRELIGAKATRAASQAPDLISGKTFVFTGALALFTRDQAEGIVVQRGGKASGSVSKGTDYVVAGDKAGSKLTRAQQLGVPVVTEQQFQEMLEGKMP